MQNKYKQLKIQHLDKSGSAPPRSGSSVTSVSWTIVSDGDRSNFNDTAANLHTFVLFHFAAVNEKIRGFVKRMYSTRGFWFRERLTPAPSWWVVSSSVWSTGWPAGAARPGRTWQVSLSVPEREKRWDTHGGLCLRQKMRQDETEGHPLCQKQPKRNCSNK